MARLNDKLKGLGEIKLNLGLGLVNEIDKVSKKYMQLGSAMEIFAGGFVIGNIIGSYVNIADMIGVENVNKNFDILASFMFCATAGLFIGRDRKVVCFKIDKKAISR